MAFKLAQTFYIDKTTVRDAENVTLTSIDLFFKSKPRETANRSGITAPGVNLFILETRENDLPNVDRPVETGYSRRDYNEIVATSDATVRTNFTFTKPVVLQTNKSYAIAISFDGDEDYKLWTCREGELIVGTNVVTSGSTARNVGKYFEYSSSIEGGNTNVSINEQWKALNNVDLKFSVYVGAYSANVVSTEINSTYVLPSDPMEYVLYDRYSSKTVGRNNAQVGEMIFQETPVIYGAINVSSNSTTITCSNSINFSNLLRVTEVVGGLPANSTPVAYQKSYIVLRNGSDQTANVNIREVKGIISNTEIVVDRLPTFTSNVATFSVTAAGRLAHTGVHWYTGRWWDHGANTMNSFTGRKTDILRVSETNANSTVRFVNNMVEAITIQSGGTGYSNSDVVTVYPITNANTSDPTHVRYIEAFANATANVVTNGSGTITALAITNAGYGMTGNVGVTITTSGGTTANLIPLMGSTLRCETSNTTFGNTVVTNVEVHRSYPHMHVVTNQHHTYRMFQHYPYYINPGKEHILNASSPASVREIDTFKNQSAFDVQNNDGRVYVLASKSNEVKMSSNVTITVANGASVATTLKSSSILEVSITSNNAFSMPMLASDDVYNYKYIINNNATGEHKGNGRALSRHISKKVSFAENRNAEDVVVYLDAYRPAGTTIKVYARVHAADDSEAFDDKDWTELQLQSNNASAVSSLTNDQDIIEFTYGLPKVPKSYSTSNGTITTTLSSAVVNGIDTAFNTYLVAGDVVKVYSPLFPNNYQVSTVDSIANSSQLTLKDVISTSDVVGSGLKLDLIGRLASGANAEIGYPLQAWSDKTNSYVCRYYDSTLAKHDTYNTFAIKIVLLSENVSIVPKIENIRSVGVSA